MRRRLLIPWMLLSFFVVRDEVEFRAAETGEETPQASASQARHGWFLEVISESSDRPLSETVASSAPLRPRLMGYLFEPAADGSTSRLYPATGAEAADADEVEFYVGHRVIDRAPVAVPGLLPPDEFEYRSLVAVNKVATEFSGETISRDELRKARAILAAGRPRVAVRIELRDGDDVLVKLADQEFVLKPGESRVIHEASETSDERGTVFHRVQVVAHGKVEVAPFDALHEWKRSRQLLREGPYEEALAATEQVLLADPAHQEALNQWKQIRALLDAGKTASVLQVQLQFAPDLDAQTYLQRWKEQPAGVVYVSNPEAPAGEALAGGMIEADRVNVPVPSGHYRVTLLLPGFRQFQQEIEINGRTTLEIPLIVADP